MSPRDVLVGPARALRDHARVVSPLEFRATASKSPAFGKYRRSSSRGQAAGMPGALAVSRRRRQHGHSQADDAAF